ncbi:MAG: YCF48-related protein [Bacteroidota bacterium]
MKNIIFGGLIILIGFSSFAQNEWTTIHPYPTLSNLIDAHFISDDEGWIVGTDGTIMHTVDGGDNWESQHSNPDESLWSIFFIDNNEGWACGWSEIYHTVDAGQNWDQQEVPYVMGDLMDVFFINHDTGWIVGTYKIVLKTTDGGESWEKIQNSIGDGKCFFRVDFWDELHGCAVGNVWNGSTEGFVMVTDDGGLSWTETTPANSDWLTDVEYYNSMVIWTCGYDGNVWRSLDGGYTWFNEYYGSDSFDAIHFFDDDNGMLMTGNSVLLSFDGGDNWDSTAYIYPSFNSFHAFMSWESSKGVAVGYDGIISRTMDGGSTWEKLNKGLDIYFNRLGFFDTFNGLAIGGIWNNAQLIRTYDGGYNWDYDTVMGTTRFYNLYMDGQNCYLLNDSSQMMKTNDGGLNWDVLTLPDLTAYYADFLFVNENTGYCCGNQGVFIKTVNGGQSWEDKSLGVAFNLSKVFFVDEMHGWMINYDAKEVLRTSDGGDTWASSQLGSTVIYQPISIFFHNENVGWVSTDDGLLYKSTDGGKNWELLYGFVTGSYSQIHFVNESEGWFLDGFRMYHTYDGGISWSDGESFGSHPRTLFFLDADRGWTGGSSGLIATYDGTVDVNEVVSGAFEIAVFPNPAHKIIYINTVNHDTENISIGIFNMEGKLVLNTTQSPGDNRCSVDISSLASGTYIIKASSEKGQYAEKFIKY